MNSLHFVQCLRQQNFILHLSILWFKAVLLFVGMHNTYRTDKLSTDMSENDVIFIAPINKWNPISRSDKAVWFIRDSSAFRVQETAALNCSDSQLVSRSFRHHLWTCLCRSGSFSRWQRRTIPLLFATHVQQGFREEGKKASGLNIISYS